MAERTHVLKGKAKGGGEDDSNHAEPPETEACPIGEFEKWALHYGFPYRAYGSGDNGVRDEAKCDDARD
jgi:hypothetical protein